MPLQTPHICSGADCKEHGRIDVATPVVLLQFVLPAQSERGMVLQPFMNQAGGFAYETHFLHEECWAAYFDALRELIEEEEALEGDIYTFIDNRSPVKCMACSSNILLNEPSLYAQSGMFGRSNLSPNGEAALSFDINNSPDSHWLLCLTCARLMNRCIIKFWEVVSYNGECFGCSVERFWRTNTPCTHPHLLNDLADQQQEDEDAYDDGY